MDRRAAGQFTNNVVRHVAPASTCSGRRRDLSGTNDIAIRNNLFLDISRANWGGSGWLMVTQGGDNLVFDHNTVFTDGTSVV